MTRGTVERSTPVANRPGNHYAWVRMVLFTKRLGRIGTAAVVLCLLGGVNLPAHQRRAESLQFTFGGDLMVHDPIFQLADFGEIFRALRPILLRDDLSFLNLEFVIRPDRPPQGYPYFNAPVELVEAAVNAGVDVVSIANNHTLDHGVRGVETTLEALRELQSRHEGRPYFSGYGAGLEQWTPDAHLLSNEFPAPTAIEVRGRRVGFVAVTQFSNENPGNEVLYRTLWVVNGSNREQFVAYVEEHAPTFDVFVVSYHGDWVEEYRLEAVEAKRAFFRRLIEAGTTVVWGHHPHVMQDWFVHEHSEGQGVAILSNGNFVSAQGFRLDPASPDPQNRWAHTHDSLLFRVHIDWDSQDRARIAAIHDVPIFQYILPGRTAGVIVHTPVSLFALPLEPQWERYYRARLVYLRALAQQNRPRSSR